MGLRRVTTVLLTVVFAVLLLGASGDRFKDLGHRMICICGCNQLLLECNHVGCEYSDRMREQLLSAIQRDRSDESVMQSFVHEYGTTVLAAPTSRGFDNIAWIMPFLVLLAGGIVAIATIRNWKEEQATRATSTALSPTLMRYVERARKETEL